MISDSKFEPQEIAAGAILSVVLALAAYAIAYRYGAPAMLMGLLLGLSCHFLSESDRFARGLLWAIRSHVFGLASLYWGPDSALVMWLPSVGRRVGGLCRSVYDTALWGHPGHEHWVVIGI